MTEWLDKHMLPVNVDKCVCVHLNQTRQGHSYHLGSLELRTSTCERDLGSLVTSKLSVDASTARLATLAQNRLGVLNRLVGPMEKRTFCVLYKTFVRPFLETNIQAFSPYCRRDIDLLESVQPRATKRVKGLWSIP